MQHLADDIQHIFAALVAVIVGLGMVASALLFFFIRLRMLWLAIRKDMSRTDMIVRAMFRRGDIAAKQILASEGESAVSTSVQNDVRHVYELIGAELRRFRAHNPGITREDFVEWLECKYGEWLIQHVCQPFDLRDFECWAIAWRISGEPEDKPDSWKREKKAVP